MGEGSAPGSGQLMLPDTSSWTKIGSSSNAEFYVIEPHILAVVPNDGCRDDEASAQQSVNIQLDYLRNKMERAGVIVFVDRVAEQSAAARTVYRDAPDPMFHACFALVGGTMFGRAVGSIFIGLNRPRIPTRLFADFASAYAWARQMSGAE